jgi:HAD superfamily phosphoserine phosphatase-like hydrolase
MDGTLLKGRTIVKMGEAKGNISRIHDILESREKSYVKTIKIAKCLKCMTTRKFLDVFRTIPLQKDVEYVINELRKKKIKTAIVTDSYTLGACDLKKRLGIDYVFANKLIIEKGHISGDIVLQNTQLSMKHPECLQHSICKGEIVLELAKKLGITTKEIIAIGDSMVDICMLQQAGLGIAFQAPKVVRDSADISTNDFIDVLKYV